MNKKDNSKDTSEYISKFIKKEKIFDINDLNRYFIEFKSHMMINLNNDWNEIYFTKKEYLDLRFH